MSVRDMRIGDHVEGFFILQDVQCKNNNGRKNLT